MDIMADDIADIASVARTADASSCAEFSKDMAETLARYFDIYAEDGVVEVVVTEHGLWLRNPVTGGRQFLGLARIKGVN